MERYVGMKPPSLDEYDRARRQQEAQMGTDIQLLYREDDGKAARVLASLGRKDYFQLADENLKDYEQHEYDAAIKTAHLKMYCHFMLGWKPDTIEIANEAMLDVEQVIEGFAEAFIKYGQRMLLAQILNDAGEYLELEDC